MAQDKVSQLRLIQNLSLLQMKTQMQKKLNRLQQQEDHTLSGHN